MKVFVYTIEDLHDSWYDVAGTFEQAVALADESLREWYKPDVDGPLTMSLHVPPASHDQIDLVAQVPTTDDDPSELMLHGSRRIFRRELEVADPVLSRTRVGQT